MVDISRAIAIAQGMSVEDLEWLAAAARGKRWIVELGAFHGRSTRALLDNSEAHIWCIDHWKGSRPGVSHGLVVDGDDFGIFLENVGDVKDRVTILKMSTREAIGFLTEGCYDMVVIDADHRYEAVRFDIANYATLLCRGGLLCGHDARAGWEGVDRAVEELITHPREGGRAMWWVVREEEWLR